MTTFPACTALDLEHIYVDETGQVKNLTLRIAAAQWDPRDYRISLYAVVTMPVVLTVVGLLLC